MPLEARIADRMAALESANLIRTLQPPVGVDLSSNDYLGLAQHPQLKQRMAEAALREGCGSTGSRLLRGERDGLSALERRFAQFKGTEAGLYFSSGYLANLAVLSTFPEEDDVIFSDALNHASLIDGMRLSRARRVVFAHSGVASLSAQISASAAHGQRFLVVESVFSMDGDLAPLSAYAALAREHGLAMIVDEAHATGIYGERGTGLASNAFLSIHPMGKAFGVAGAFVCGPAWAIDYLIQRARPFVFTTAPPPPVAATLEAALDLVEGSNQLRQRLIQLSRFLRGLLADRGFDVAREGSQIVPVMIGGNRQAVEIAAGLQKSGFDVRAIRPPTVPEGTARLRISVNVNLTEAILRDFADALAAEAKRLAA